MHLVKSTANARFSRTVALAELFLVLDLLYLVQLIQQHVGAHTGLLDYAHGTLTCVLQLLFFLSLKLGKLLLQLAFGHLCVALGYSYALFQLLQLLTGSFQSVHNLLEALVFRAYKALCKADDIIGHSKL